MILIACVDDKMGMMFNNRRQSQDKILREHILAMTNGSRLWMNHYSAKMFGDAPQINIDEDFLMEAGEGDYCFAESSVPIETERWCEKIILYKWNRRYPADQAFLIPLENRGWVVESTEDFPGNSHENITMEVYVRYAEED